MNQLKNIFEKTLYFFPIQLIFIQFRKNHLLLLSWIFLFAVITGNFGSAYGIPSLFLIPEYLNTVNMLSYFLLGISLGVFIMSYHISGYVTGGYLFPFLATLPYPFWKYSINNSAVPLLFLVVYIINSAKFQRNEELLDTLSITMNTGAFLTGVFLFILISFLWFFTANIDISKIYTEKEEVSDKEKNPKIIKKIIEKDTEWKILNTPNESGKYWKVKMYLSNPFRLKRARYYSHYRADHIQKVLKHNYKNVLFFSFAVLITVLITGIFKDSKIIIIPAAASINIFLSLIILSSAAVFSFFKDWNILFLIIAVIALNFISKHSSLEYHQSAYGLDYNVQCNIADSLTNNTYEIRENDFNNTINILNKRKEKLTKRKNEVPIVFINTSGGGLRTALWTYVALHYADSVTNGKLLKHTQLITGASGGMLGAAYLRELYLRKQNKQMSEWYNDTLVDAISKDILNPVAFSLASGDWFFHFQKFSYNKKRYYKDRAYIWEKTLNENTFNFMDKPLIAYSEHEAEAIIPMLIFSPSEVEHGRKILISSQDISYFEKNSQTGLFAQKRSAVNIDFRRKYKEYGADSLRFLTAIRMSSTFPYITPYVNLPGNPQLRILDAGLHDNYGLSTSLEFVSIFREWLKQNTSKIIFVQIIFRDKSAKKENTGLISSVVSPFSGVFQNFFTFQQMNFEKQLMQMDKHLKENITFINIVLESEKEISISWRLTEEEKRLIMQGVKDEANIKAINVLKDYLDY